MHGSQVWRTSLQTACGLPKYCDIVTAETQTKSTHRITSAQNGKKLEVDGLFPANPSSEFSPRSHLNPRSPLRGEAGGFDDRDCSASVELALEWSCVRVLVLLYILAAPAIFELPRMLYKGSRSTTHWSTRVAHLFTGLPDFTDIMIYRWLRFYPY